MRLIHGLRLTGSISHSGIDWSEQADVDTCNRERFVGHRNCTPKRVASWKIYREKINRPLGSDKTPILLSNEGLFQLLHEFNAVRAAGTKPAEKVNVTQAPLIAETDLASPRQ